nr:GNAT family N-acetyltransferase [Pleionea sp. CnH1-48]
MLKVFRAVQGKTFSSEGQNHFDNLFTLERNQQRWEQGQKFWIAKNAQRQVIGVIALREASHIFALYVDRDYQRQGIANALWQTCLNFVMNESIPAEKVTVYASEYALEVYEKWGFVRMGELQVSDGLEFIPMAYSTPVSAVQ